MSLYRYNVFISDEILSLVGTWYWSMENWERQRERERVRREVARKKFARIIQINNRDLSKKIRNDLSEVKWKEGELKCALSLSLSRVSSYLVRDSCRHKLAQSGKYQVAAPKREAVSRYELSHLYEIRLVTRRRVTAENLIEPRIHGGMCYKSWLFGMHQDFVSNIHLKKKIVFYNRIQIEATLKVKKENSKIANKIV